jgi:WD40 repeat protein
MTVPFTPRQHLPWFRRLLQCHVQPRPQAILLVTLAILTGACHPAAELPIADSAGTAALPPAFTHTVPGPTETPRPSETPAPAATATNTMKYFSVEPEPSQMKSADMAGKVVLTGPGRYRHFLYDLQSREITELPGAFVYFDYDGPLELSPDRTAFAYTEITGQGTVRVYIGTDGGKSLAPYLIPNKGRYVVVGWLDDNSIALADMKGTDGVIWVMRSADGSLSRLVPPFPLVTDDGPLAWGAGWIFAHYSRTCSHVVTARWIDNQADVEPFVPMRYTYELWDVDLPRLLWIASGGGFSGPPVWNASGDQFLVAYPPYQLVPDYAPVCAEVHVITSAGDDRLLDDCSWPDGYSLSPDGMLVASWMGEGGQSPSEPMLLRVFDLAHNSIRNYALRFDKYTFIWRGRPPIWSPDGRFLAFSESDGDGGPLRSWVLDLETGEAGLLMSGTQVDGWIQ